MSGMCLWKVCEILPSEFVRDSPCAKRHVAPGMLAPVHGLLSCPSAKNSSCSWSTGCCQRAQQHLEKQNPLLLLQEIRAEGGSAEKVHFLLTNRAEVTGKWHCDTHTQCAPYSAIPLMINVTRGILQMSAVTSYSQ